MIVNVKNTPELSQLPIAATPKSAAYDVIAVSEPEIVGEKDGDYWKRIDYIQYHTALFTAPQSDSYGRNYHILIHPRSSVSKYNLVLANGIGLVDNDYRGEMLVRYKYLWQPEDMWWTVRQVPGETPDGDLISNNDGLHTVRKTIRGIINMDRIYKKGDRVAQLVVEPTTDAEWVRVENLDETIRGTGGFGSTTIPITNREVKEETKTKPVQKTYESKVDLVEQWRKHGGNVERPPTYETLIKEREKSIT